MGQSRKLRSCQREEKRDTHVGQPKPIGSPDLASSHTYARGLLAIWFRPPFAGPAAGRGTGRRRAQVMAAPEAALAV
jgi:hypothetical protein